MVVEQSKETTLIELKIGIQNEKVPNAVQKRCVIIDDILYYISNIDSIPISRLYIPEHLGDVVIEQYHDCNGRMGSDKIYDSSEQKYYWPNLYKQ